MSACQGLQTFSIAGAETFLSEQKNFQNIGYLQRYQKQLQTKGDAENATNCIHTFVLKSNRKIKSCN